ncbi:putative nucleotide-diphospho-sugar transferase [Candidatus Odyssella acanthamoebae]|uniref:putative nucleotide-diphospho-sugar transferase n=1 Tax=Candidatus Odyssella acanthamoebae TaxID=91604 RepID=UPI0012EBC399|nr:putative nucleotide-diphospho-sugar transferase [Candidatus Paracaedibacter acanthamoebae]
MRRILKYSLYLIIALMAGMILEYARQGFMNDMSIQPVNRYSAPDLEASEPTGRPPVFLVTYAAGGEQYFRNQNAVSQYAVNKGIDFILNYRKSHIDKDFFEKNRSIFNEKIGAGMWVWKPYIILRTMESAPDDSIIVYMDSAFKIRKPIPQFIEKLGDSDVMLIQDQDRRAGAYVKGDSFYLLNCKDEACRQAPLIWSAIVVVRNSSRSRSFIKKWLEACQEEQALNATAYNYMPNYLEYKWHHFDQSLLSLIYHKNSEGVKVLSYEEVDNYFIGFHRQAGRSSSNKSWYTVYGAEPTIDLNGGSRKLSSTSLLNTGPIVWLRKQIAKRWDVGG